MSQFIVITGAAGMIGSGVVRCLNDRGFSDLLLVDDFKESDKWKNLVGKKFYDFISRHKIFDYLHGKEREIDAVIHLGACSDTEEKNGDYLMENNYRFSVKLAEWALSHNKRFIYASSAATYGDGTLGFSDDEDALESLRPLNMYGFSKHLVDLWLKREGGLKKAVGLKYFNVFGPNEYHKGRMASMVLKMTQKAQDEGVIRLYKSTQPHRFKDGEQCRDFIYIKDAVRMTCDFLEPEHRSLAGLFNIGRGEPATWNHLAHALFGAINQASNIEYIDMPCDLAKQYQNYTCADMRKFHRCFPRHISAPIAESVREYVQEYLLRSARW
ncbi:MAG: hldD [Parachlamydiales bacterium]|nr:hldD [Parachlamydiales bacterium]